MAFGAVDDEVLWVGSTGVVQGNLQHLDVHVPPVCSLLDGFDLEAGVEHGEEPGGEESLLVFVGHRQAVASAGRPTGEASWSRAPARGAAVLVKTPAAPVADFGPFSATFWGGALGSFEGEVVER